MVLAGGFGGWPFGHMNYTGISCMSDVWQYDGQQWSLLTDAAAFDSRAWFVFSVLHVDRSTIPEKMFLFSGGNVGTYVRTHAYIYRLVLPEQNKMSDNVNEDEVELKW